MRRIAQVTGFLEDRRQLAEVRFMLGKPASALYAATLLARHLLLKNLPVRLLNSWKKNASVNVEVTDAYLLEHMSQHAQADTIWSAIRRLMLTQSLVTARKNAMADPAQKWAGAWTAPFDAFWSERREWGARKGLSLRLSPADALIDAVSPGGPYTYQLEALDAEVLPSCRKIIEALAARSEAVRSDVDRGLYRISPEDFKRLVEERIKRHGTHAAKIAIVWTDDTLFTRRYGANTTVFLKRDPGEDFVRALQSVDHEVFGHGEARYVSGLRPALQRRGESGDETDAHLFDYFSNRTFPQAVETYGLLREMGIAHHPDLTPVRLYLRMVIPDSQDTRQESDLLRLPLYNAHRLQVFKDMMNDASGQPPHTVFITSWYARYHAIFGTEAPHGSHFEDLQMFCAPERQVGAYAAGLYAAAGFYDALMTERVDTYSLHTMWGGPVVHSDARDDFTKHFARSALGFPAERVIALMTGNFREQGGVVSFLHWYKQNVSESLSAEPYLRVLKEVFAPLIHTDSLVTLRPDDPPLPPKARSNPVTAGRPSRAP